MERQIKELTAESESHIKVCLALYIVISHCPGSGIIGVFNYLPVAGFFFLSGYGLEKSSRGGYGLSRFIQSLIKILVPFYICQIIYTLVFLHIGSGTELILRLLKGVFLIEIVLPYAWYVRTQIILYIIWFFASRIKNWNVRLCVTFICVVAYILICRVSGQIFTSYKTVLAFAFGIWFCQHEKPMHGYINRAGTGFICLIFACVLRLCVRSEGWLDIVVFSLSGILFSLFVVFLLYRYNLVCYTIKKLAHLSYEIYLVQGISQCIFLKMGFCDRSIFDMNNVVAGNILAVVTTLALAAVLHLGSAKIMKLNEAISHKHKNKIN